MIPQMSTRAMLVQNVAVTLIKYICIHALPFNITHVIHMYARVYTYICITHVCICNPAPCLTTVAGTEACNHASQIPSRTLFLPDSVKCPLLCPFLCANERAHESWHSYLAWLWCMAISVTSVDCESRAFMLIKCPRALRKRLHCMSVCSQPGWFLYVHTPIKLLHYTVLWVSYQTHWFHKLQAMANIATAAAAASAERETSSQHSIHALTTELADLRAAHVVRADWFFSSAVLKDLRV